MSEPTPKPPSVKTYTASSGNICRCRFETGKDEQVGVAAHWHHKPSDEDLREVMDWVARDTGVDALIHAGAGAGRAGAARSAEAVRRFLKTGDPGVAIEVHEAHAREKPPTQ